ncbi:hypothetical protein P0E69_09460 [Chimaeribacter arupi]|uniref:transcriptional antitermination N peptide n=1 Tax=Chimaeribacter arupi TaxID=2060066 RepID=UPI0027121B80|nr:hypothetical protein [Chimaeribacter arupi]WKZ94073.1 hypothetical protein P0E69_09460 [Chimaeribacter arupi]
MATIIWKESKGTAKSRYKARRAAMIADRRGDQALSRKVAVAVSGCSIKVAKATTLPTLREKTESTATCLPQVAIYNAGFRKPVDKFSAR